MSNKVDLNENEKNDKIKQILYWGGVMITVFNRITAFFTSLIIALGSFFCLFKPAVPKAISADELINMGGIFEKHELADTIYVTGFWSLKNEEFNTLKCLQGLVNRDKVHLFLMQCGQDPKYRSMLAESGKKIIEMNKTLPELIEFFSEYIEDSGFVLYRDSEFGEGLNTACNYAIVKGWLPIPVELKETAESCGLKIMKDISDEEYNYKFQQKFFDEYKDEFSKAGIVHIRTSAAGLRDFGIQQRLFFCYTKSDAAGDRFLKRVLNKTAKNGVVLGWCEQEKHFVELISKCGFSIIPADHSANLSVLNNFSCEIPDISTDTAINPDPDKHYISLIFSDGDNVQWMTNGCSEFYRGQRIERNYPITWGIPEVCQELCSATAVNMKLGVQHEGDSFIAGPSGIGYALPSAFEEKSMDKYTTVSAAAMLKSNVRVACLLDDRPSAINEAAFARKFDFYSRFDNIDGGIIFLDPAMYSAGQGRIWFSNDKPFLTVKKTLWSDIGYDGVTDEWMKAQADEINSYVADNHSINGYSAICIHAWSVTPENLDKLVGMLDSHIEIVNTDQLIKMITENVPHKDARPE